MDIARPKQPKTRQYVIIGAIVVALLAGTAFLTKLEPAAPSVDRATLWIDTVRRGTMLREVRAPGTLIPEHVRIISALTQGRVERLITRPGTAVKANTPILELSNPDVQLETLEAERQLGQAEAELLRVRMSLETDRLQQRSAAASAQSEFQEAKRAADVMAGLDAKGLAGGNEKARAADRVQELGVRRDVEARRMALLDETQQEQLSLARRNVERLRAITAFQRQRLAGMAVVAGEEGVLQQLDLELGQWVLPGQALARVAQPGRLKAVLRVPETQARDIVIGQPVKVDTRTGDARTGVVSGRVIRVDPSVQNGTVTVEVGLEGTLPRGARPDLSVDGTIEIERLDDVMHLGRPAYGQAESTVGLFVLDADGVTARRVQVKLGRSSVNTIEVAQGLNVGDKVIISDVSQWDAQERLKIK